MSRLDGGRDGRDGRIGRVVAAGFLALASRRRARRAGHVAAAQSWTVVGRPADRAARHVGDGEADDHEHVERQRRRIGHRLRHRRDPDRLLRRDRGQRRLGDRGHSLVGEHRQLAARHRGGRRLERRPSPRRPRRRRARSSRSPSPARRIGVGELDRERVPERRLRRATIRRPIVILMTVLGLPGDRDAEADARPRHPTPTATPTRAPTPTPTAVADRHPDPDARPARARRPLLPRPDPRQRRRRPRRPAAHVPSRPRRRPRRPARRRRSQGAAHAGGGNGGNGGGSGPAGGGGSGPAPAPGVRRRRSRPARRTTGLDTGGLLGLGGLDWAVPGAILAGPGLLLMLLIAFQALGALAWLPVVRRRIGSFGPAGRRPTRPA